jgi:hypothetical protein
METRRQQMTKGGGIDGYSNFMGDDDEYKDWYGVIGQSRDSRPLERSNFRVALNMLGGEGDNVRIERYGHWAVGWIEEVYVRPGTQEYTIAEGIKNSLADYPVLSDNDFSAEESEEANDVWAHCYNEQERIEYIRKNHSQFDFRDFADLRATVRGEYFTGYASELLD